MNHIQRDADLKATRDIMFRNIEKLEKGEITHRQGHALACMCSVVQRAYAIQAAPTQYGEHLGEITLKTVSESDAA